MNTTDFVRRLWVDPRLLAAVAPSLGLGVVALLSATYITHPGLYAAILYWAGVTPFRYPFVDWDYVGAGIRCWNGGHDVYVSDPCDVLGRLQDYSPLWLRMTFIPTSASWTAALGLGLSAAFFLSIPLLFRPKGWRDTVLVTLACVSSMVSFGLERANVDLLIFLMILLAGSLLTRSAVARLVAYAVFLLTALLKYYPLVLMALVLGERPRLLRLIIPLSAMVVGLFLLIYGQEALRSLPNIPQGSPFGEIFGIGDLPGGLISGAGRLGSAPPKSLTALTAGARLMMTLGLFGAGLGVSRHGGFKDAIARTTGPSATWLMIGCLLVAGCYLTGPSNNYRGVFLLFVLCGLIGLRDAASDRFVRALAVSGLVIVIVLMWMDAIRRWFGFAVQSVLGTNAPPMIAKVAIWGLRELLWLYLVSLMLAILAAYAQKSRLVQELGTRLSRAKPTREARQRG